MSLLSLIFGLTHASKDEADAPCSQETFERYSKNVYEGIIQYLDDMVTITNGNGTPKSKTELMVGELLTLKDTINDVIEAAEISKEKDIGDSIEADETLRQPKNNCKSSKFTRNSKQVV